MNKKVERLEIHLEDGIFRIYACSECRHEVDYNDNYCGECGAGFEEE